LIVKPIC